MYAGVAIAMAVFSTAVAVFVTMLLPLNVAGRAVQCPACWHAGQIAFLVLIQAYITYRVIGKFFSAVTIEEDGTVAFHSLVRTRRVRPAELLSISGVSVKEGDLIVGYRSGTVELPALLERRDALVERLKSLNPDLKVEKY
jgi:hypothetical protein